MPKKSKTANSAPAMPKMMKPSMRMDMPTGMDMSGMKADDHVHVSFRGKIKRMEMGRDYDGKMRNSLEVEHDPKSVKVTKTGKRTIEELEDANERV